MHRNVFPVCVYAGGAKNFQRWREITVPSTSHRSESGFKNESGVFHSGLLSNEEY